MDLLHTILYWTFVAGICIFMTGFAITLSHAKNIQKTWSTPVWFTNIAIAVLSMFAGLPFCYVFLKITNIDNGPWNILTMIFFGVTTKNILLYFVRKYWEKQLTTFSLKHFG